MLSEQYYQTKCFLCGKTTDEKVNNTVCTYCGGPLDVEYDYDQLKAHINSYALRTAPSRVIKYLDFFPLIERRTLFSLGEGGTPLHHAKNLGKKLDLPKLYIKNEGLNPTGAFKDRGSFVELNKAKELGYKTVCVASTGNMAASVAAYAAQAEMTCYVFVPENTPRGKLAQALSYGAHVIQVRGTYADAYTLTMSVAKEYGFYLAGDYAFRGEGQKSLSYEVAEQLGFSDIDWVIVPVGMGTNISYIWKGFCEYYELGLIKKLPRMVAVQAKGSAPIVEAFKTKKPLTKVEKPHTICSAIAVGNPIDAPKVLRALADSKGLALAVNDDDTLKGQQELAKLEALYVEPSAATTIAALHMLKNKNLIKPTDTIVCVATGAGLKDPATTLKVLAEPPTIEPVLSEVKRILKSGILSLRAGAVGEREKLLFTKVPTPLQVKTVLTKEFGMTLDDKLVGIITNVVTKFIKGKGKHIAKADLQSIVETVIQDERRTKTLEIVDYKVTASKKDKPHAQVLVSLKGKSFSGQSDGVGPVDAVVNAIVKAISHVDKEAFALTDYAVEIPTTGSDATVEVTMTLSDAAGAEVIEKGTSPDIIVASLEAFEKGYNELVYQRSSKLKVQS